MHILSWPFLNWVGRGLRTRLGMMAAQIPPSPHRRDPEVSKHFQVAGDPPKPREDEKPPFLQPHEKPHDDPKQEPQYHPAPDRPEMPAR